MLLWRRQSWTRSLGGFIAALVLTLFIAAPSLDRIACADDAPTLLQAAAFDHPPVDAHSHDDAGGKPHCEYCHQAAHWLTPVLTPSRAPTSIAYRAPTPILVGGVSWPDFPQDRPPRARRTDCA